MEIAPNYSFNSSNAHSFGYEENLITLQWSCALHANSSHILQTIELETVVMNQRNHLPLLFHFWYPPRC